MTDSCLFPPSPETVVGYCTNVHAGTDLASIKSNLQQYAVPVSEQLGVDRLGVGLWLPDQASVDLMREDATQGFRDFLRSNGLNAFTINGFPFGNFHGDHVKQRVYLPTWADPARLEYTKRLATILAALLDDDAAIGSISTLPIGWPDNPFAETRALDHDAAGRQFRELADYLDSLQASTGKRIVVAIEPEPGCGLDTIDDMVEFFQRQLPEERHRRLITACHDICHSAVMNEPQRDVIRRYAEAGIGIGKIQVSSAIVADWRTIQTEDREATLRQLSEFAEDRYLHQTGCLHASGDFELAEDLPDLVKHTPVAALDEIDRWVIHFHVPIFLERFGHLTTSRDAVLDCLRAITDPQIDAAFSGHLEVETYAWTVLPREMRRRGLAEDITSEIAWLNQQL
ncbi:MAG: metabolite traffic protein EboE [Planctomycetota bacterium]